LDQFGIVQRSVASSPSLDLVSSARPTTSQVLFLLFPVAIPVELFHRFVPP
uniref:Uncharacterized protein n=1 Tax=Anopheles quadriannulatus TaxID=34691 RepID=A0A182XU36_ANOQN